jgi:gamma-tubulin complex component 3
LYNRYAVAYRELAAESVANLEVGEQELVRDVLFACQGIDGKEEK